MNWLEITSVAIIIILVVIIPLAILGYHILNLTSPSRSYAFSQYYNKDFGTNSFDLTGYVQGTWEPLRDPVSITLASNSSDFTSKNNIVTYNGLVGKAFKMTISGSAYADLPDHITEWGVFRNSETTPFKNLYFSTNSIYAIEGSDTGMSSSSAIGIIYPGDTLTIKFRIIEPFTNTIINVENLNLCISEV